MLFDADIDLSKYTDKDGRYTEAGKKALLDEAAVFFEEYKESKKFLNVGSCIVKGKINEKLQERSALAYETVISLVEEEYSRSIAPKDEELRAFSLTPAIYRLEAENLPVTIYDRIDYVDDFEKIYTRVRFFFRRLQLGYSDPAAIRFIREQNISVYLLAELLKEMTIGKKKLVAEKISGLYSAANKVDAARYMSDLAEEL
ncbi:MAG: hypothetical protein K5686_06675 [Lachnospiraceae bacterium]|nr:hypothetical protein [Lachnospiraceae bacterium]